MAEGGQVVKLEELGNHGCNRNIALEGPSSMTSPLVTPIVHTPAPSEGSAQSPEDTPVLEDHEDFNDSHRPAKRRRKAPRPGESTFRVPMSMEQRHSLGIGVRPRQQNSAGSNRTIKIKQFSPGHAEASPATRGGTKMKFRAYGSTSTPTPSPRPSQTACNGEPSQSTFAASEQPTVIPPSKQILDINFLTAPLESSPKLAWWLAQQISHMSAPSASNPNPQVAEIPASQFYGHEDSSQRKRQTDRERKARWREANSERNRDNDLRARVNRQARIRFGEPDTPEKNAWVMHEITRRKGRREEKQISRAAKSGHFPAFSESDQIRNSLLDESLMTQLHPAIQRLRKLVVDVLFPAPDEADHAHRYQASQILSEAITNRHPHEDELFRAAFISIAMDEMTLTTIKATMEQFVTDDDEEPEYDGYPMTPGNSNPPNHRFQALNVIRTLNEALGLLRELDASAKRQQKSLEKATKRSSEPRKPSVMEYQQHLAAFDMTESIVEDFLVLSNGGPLQSDSDDDIAVELFGEDLHIEVPLPAAPTRAKHNDTNNQDLLTHTNRLIDMLLEQCIQPPKRGRRAKKSVDDETNARKQAARVKMLIADLEADKNSMQDTAELEALSDFHARLIQYQDSGDLGLDIELPNAAEQPESIALHSFTGIKRKRDEETPSVPLSPAVGLPLPDATNPFAADDAARNSCDSPMSQQPRILSCPGHILAPLLTQSNNALESEARHPYFSSYPQLKSTVASTAHYLP